MPLSKVIGTGGSSFRVTVPPLSKANSACVVAGAGRMPRIGSGSFVGLPSACVSVSVPWLCWALKLTAAISMVSGTSRSDSRS
jgi:hypothetical protein